MTVIFESIVKNENSLPEDREIIRGFPFLPQSLSWQGGNRVGDPAGTKASCKSKENGVPRRAKWFCHQ
jgi:hypothetical protein